MKLSNKILLGFFGFIFLYLTAAFAEWRINGVPDILNFNNGVVETANISAVTHLKIKDIDRQIQVVGADRAELQVLSPAGNVLKDLAYEISGDTLVLSALRTEDKEVITVSVYLPKTALRRITIDHSSVSVNGLESDVLNVVQSSGRMWMRDSRIERMNLNLSDASLEISYSNVDSLSAKAEKSNVHIYSPIGVVEGTLTSETIFFLADVKEIQLKEDDNSRLTISH